MKLKLTTIVFLFVLNFTFSQENYTYKFTYDIDFKPFKNDTTRMSERMVLLSGKKTSMFLSPTKIVLDSVRKDYQRKGLSPYDFIEFKKNYPKNRMTYLVKKENGKITYQNKVATKHIEYQQNKPNFNWKIQDTTTTILGYSCQLAKTTYMGRDYEAWFSSDVPIQDGPYKFSGLPGLIFKIYDTQNEFIFTIKSIEKETKPFPSLEEGKSVVKTTHKDVNKVSENIFMSFANRLDQATRRKMVMTMKKSKNNTNRLELTTN